MEKTDIANIAKDLHFEHPKLDMLICKEGTHIWNNLIRIEQIKREKLREKHELLRKKLQTN